MDIKQLRYFQKVADAGSVSRAAAALSVAQPAVSRQIANLEDSLGTALFFRNGRGVKLTDAGAQLYGHANAILESIRQAERDVRDTVGVARGTIVIGSTPSIVRLIAPPLLSAVEQRHPELALEFTEGLSGYVNEWLSNGLLDIAIIHDATRTQHFLTEPLLREDLVFLSKKGGEGPITLAEVAEHDLILPRKAHGLRLHVERAAAQMRLALSVRAEVDSMNVIKHLVAQGPLATVVPRGALDPSTRELARTIVDPPMARLLLLATSSQRPVSQTTRLVIQELKLAVRNLTETGQWPGARRPNEPPASQSAPPAKASSPPHVA